MKKTVIIGGVEYIDATKSENIKAIISGFAVAGATMFLFIGSIWAIVENIIL